MNYRNNLFHLSLTLGTTLLLTTASAEQNRFYVRADVGGTSTRDVELREFFGQAIVPNSEISLEPGIRVGVRAGYGLTDWLAAEVETGVSANSVESVSGAIVAEGSLASVPLLLNARLHVPDHERFSPYIGAGFGLATTMLTADDIIIGGTSFNGTTADAVFAYQGFAGVDFAINNHMSIGAEYRYFNAEPSNMTADITVGTPTDRVKLGRIETHSVTVAFKFRF